MDEFETLRAELAAVTNLSALARASGLSRKQLQRIRSDRDVSNTTLRTMNAIRAGIKQMREADKAAA